MKTIRYVKYPPLSLLSEDGMVESQCSILISEIQEHVEFRDAVGGRHLGWICRGCGTHWFKTDPSLAEAMLDFHKEHCAR